MEFSHEVGSEMTLKQGRWNVATCSATIQGFVIKYKTASQ